MMVEYNNLIVQGNIKVRNNTNLARPITEYRITHLIWDLTTSNLKIRVEYYNNKNLVFTKDFEFEGQEEVDVNELIDKVKKQH
jgi:hypothetical protein